MSAPTDQNGRAAAQLSAVHVCQNCGAGTRRSHVPLESVINGLIRCSACGYEGPLNIEVLVQTN
jgi:ribosomal protein L32